MSGKTTVVVILAGTDGSGKTTLFNKLIKSVKYGMFISEKYPGAGLTPRLTRFRIFEQLVQADATVVYDRATVIDDFIYEEIIAGRVSALGMLKPKIAETLKRCVIIQTTCDVAVATKRLQSRGDDYIKPEMLEQIELNYERLFKEMGVSRYVLDSTHKSPDEMLAEALSIITKEKRK